MGQDRSTFHFLFAQKCPARISKNFGKLKVTGLIINRINEIIYKRKFGRCWHANVIFN